MIVNILSLDPPLGNWNEEGAHVQASRLSYKGWGSVLISSPAVKRLSTFPEPSISLSIYFVVLPICDGRFRRYIIRLLFGGFSCAAGYVNVWSAE